MKTDKIELLAAFNKKKTKHPVIHKGFFDTISKSEVPEKIAFAHLDSDLYKSIKDSLELVYPRLSENAVVVIDDYGWEPLPGVELSCNENAVREFQTNGFCIVPQLISGEKAIQLQEKFYEIFHKHEIIQGEGRIEELRNIANKSGVNKSNQENTAMWSMCYFYRQSSVFKEMCLNKDIIKFPQAFLRTRELQLFDQQLLYKPAFRGEAVEFHQDNGYWGCDDPYSSVASVWIALTEATVENGCLWVVPGTHQRMLPKKSSPIYGFKAQNFDENKAIPVELKPGDAVFMNALIVHGTKRNKSSMDRVGLEMAWIKKGTTSNGNRWVRNESFCIPPDLNSAKFHPSMGKSP